MRKESEHAPQILPPVAFGRRLLALRVAAFAPARVSRSRARLISHGVRTGRCMRSRSPATPSSSVGRSRRRSAPSGRKTSVANLAAFDMTTGAHIPSFAPTIEFTQVGGKAGGRRARCLDRRIHALRRRDLRHRRRAATDELRGRRHGDGGARPQRSRRLPNQRVLAIVATADSRVLRRCLQQGERHRPVEPGGDLGVDRCPEHRLGPHLDSRHGPMSQPASAGNELRTHQQRWTGNIRSMALAPDGTSLFVGGNFFYINGVPRNALARVSTVDGSLINWRVKWATIPSESTSNPYQGPNVVWAIVPTPTALFIGYGRTPNGFERYTMSTSASSGECAAGGCAGPSNGRVARPGTPSRWRSRRTAPACSWEATSARTLWTTGSPVRQQRMGPRLGEREPSQPARSSATGSLRSFPSGARVPPARG